MARSCLIASAGGGLDEGLKAVEDIYRAFASFIGGNFSSLLVPNAPFEEGALAQNSALREKTLAFGRELARSL